MLQVPAAGEVTPARLTTGATGAPFEDEAAKVLALLAGTEQGTPALLGTAAGGMAPSLHPSGAVGTSDAVAPAPATAARRDQQPGGVPRRSHPWWRSCPRCFTRWVCGVRQVITGSTLQLPPGCTQLKVPVIEIQTILVLTCRTRKPRTAVRSSSWPRSSSSGSGRRTWQCGSSIRGCQGLQLGTCCLHIFAGMLARPCLTETAARSSQVPPLPANFSPCLFLTQNSRVGQATVSIVAYIRKHQAFYEQSTGSGVPERVLRCVAARHAGAEGKAVGVFYVTVS